MTPTTCPMCGCPYHTNNPCTTKAYDGHNTISPGSDCHCCHEGHWTKPIMDRKVQEFAASQ